MLITAILASQAWPIGKQLFGARGQLIFFFGDEFRKLLGILPFHCQDFLGRVQGLQLAYFFHPPFGLGMVAAYFICDFS